MKVKNKDSKFDIQNIHIYKNNDNSCVVSLVCNGQYIELHLKNTYIDDIFEKIYQYLNIISDDTYIMK